MFELEQFYLLNGAPRRSFRDAKVQRLEKMAIDIAVGIKVLAAARKEDRRCRGEEARRREEDRRLREIASPAKHIDERRATALDALLEELGSLDRLRRLVVTLREAGLGGPERVRAFVALAEAQLAAREIAMSADALEQRFVEKKLFGDDDDHGFRSPNFY